MSLPRLRLRWTAILSLGLCAVLIAGGVATAIWREVGVSISGWTFGFMSGALFAIELDLDDFIVIGRYENCKDCARSWYYHALWPSWGLQVGFGHTVFIPLWLCLVVALPPTGWLVARSRNRVASRRVAAGDVPDET